MPVVHVYMNTDSSDEPERIRTFTMESVPRIGELIALEGPEFGDGYCATWKKKGQTWGHAQFVVWDVLHNVGDGLSPRPPTVTVFVHPPPADIVVSLWCTCKPMELTDDPETNHLPPLVEGRCDDCRRKRRAAREEGSN